MRDFEELYADNYSVNNNCLYEIYVSSKGTREKKICNFLPWLVREISVDDGAETKTHITISGIHEDGRTLPEVEISAEELANFTWLSNSSMERCCDNRDIAAALALLNSGMAPDEILYPMMAFAFLSPLNQFLKLADHEPKFVLFLVGKTGSRKSTLAALFLSFFGRFTGAELPLSFRDTANSILENAFSLKDVLTCIDDFHPAGYNEKQKLTDTAQAIMRAYGDRTGRSRLKADSSLMDAHPPQGNAIITGEFPPDIGESGTARYFSLELGSNSVDLDLLTAFQRLVADGTFQRCMFGFTEWLQETWLGRMRFTRRRQRSFFHLE